MKNNKNRPCPQCPFIAGCRPGWLGGNSPVEYHALAMRDEGLACHISTDACVERLGEVLEDEIEQCAGALLFAKRIGKLYRNRVLLEHQRRLTPGVQAMELMEFIKYHSPQGGKNATKDEIRD